MMFSESEVLEYVCLLYTSELTDALPEVVQITFGQLRVFFPVLFRPGMKDAVFQLDRCV